MRLDNLAKRNINMNLYSTRNKKRFETIIYWQHSMKHKKKRFYKAKYKIQFIESDINIE